VEGLDVTKPFRFTATVEIRPRLDLEPEQYRDIEVEAPSAEPTDSEIDAYIDHLRDRFAELEVVERSAATGDYVLADVRAHVHDREVPEATRIGFLSEVGSQELVPELDKELEGKRKGDILKFNATLPDDHERFGDAAGTEVAFQVLVKEVKAKRLPKSDDEFATTASEFDTLDELREDIRTKVRALKEQEVRSIVRDMVLRSLIERVEVDLPESLVDRETERHVRDLTRRAERAGITLQQALDAQGWDELRFRSDARAHAIRDLTAEFILEAVARQEDIRSEPADEEREVQALARATGRDAKEVRRILQRSGEAGSLAGDIIRSKALDHLVEHAEVTSKDVPDALPQTQGDSEDD
jgi:trigger factor